MDTVQKKVLALLIILGVVIWLSPLMLLRVFAGGSILTVSQLNSIEASNIATYVSNVNTDLKSNEKTGVTSDLLIWTREQASAPGSIVCTMEFDYATYQKLTYDEKVETMSILLNGLGDDSNVSAMNRTKIYNFIAKNDETTASLIRQLSSDMKSDYAGAYQYVRPFSGAIGIALGILTLSIFTMLSLSIVIDIGYIVIPLFQVWILNKANGQDKPRLVSAEAWAAVKSGEGSVNNGNGYESPLSFYFKFKGKQFMVLAICILYLTSGKIYDWIASIMNILSGVVG